MILTSEAVMNNRDYNGEDFSECCDWDNPDEIIYTGVE